MSHRPGPGEEGPSGELDLGQLVEDGRAVLRQVVEGSARLRQVRSRLLASVCALPTQRSRFVRWFRRALSWTVVVAAAAGALALWMAERRVATPLTLQAGQSGGAVRAGTRLRAPSDAPLALRFSDGSTLTAEARSTVVVNDLRPEGANVVLIDGAMDAAVVHRATSRWRIEAGPYTIEVTGTRFVVAWNPHGGAFSLKLNEGAVTLFGPRLGAAGRPISPLESVRLALEPPPAPSPATRSPAAPSPSMADVEPSVRYNRRLAARQSPGRADWIELAHAGRYADALSAAEAEGFASLCRRAPPGELLILANTARFAHRPERAQEAFRALRERKNGRHERAIAAFELGRLANDIDRQYRQAADWFATYLQEDAEGALAREAAGRHLEALQLAGDDDDAKRAAERYVASYPDGPYQGLARKVLGR